MLQPFLWPIIAVRFTAPGCCTLVGWTVAGWPDISDNRCIRQIFRSMNLCDADKTTLSHCRTKNYSDLSNPTLPFKN
jgi:hypothetical protein